MASQKPNAIGTPENTQKPVTPTKKIMRLILPSERSQGCANQNSAISNTTAATAPSSVLTSPVRASRSRANSAIRPMPAGNAAARQMLEICSAGVVIKLSSKAYSQAGQATSSRKASAAQVATTSNQARVAGLALATTAVIRM